MPDIREVLKSLDDQDKRLWSQVRTEMRRSYMTAHNAILGTHTWDAHDDAFVDLIDIKLALLFDKSGRMQADKAIVTEADADKIEQQIHETVASSAATRMIRANPPGEGWTSKA